MHDITEKIIDAVIDALKSNEFIGQEVKEWQKVNGLMILPCTTVSVGCENIDFTEYDRSRDEASIHLKIFAGVTDIDPERGEASAQELALQMRQALVEDHSLKGVAATSFVRRIEFVYADDAEDLHGAILSFEVKCYAPRRKPPTAPTLERVNLQIERELT